MALSEDPLGEGHRGGVRVVLGVGCVRFEDHETHAVVVVGDIAGSRREHLHCREGTPTALGGDADACLVVGVTVIEVGAGPVLGDAGHVRVQRVPVLGTVDIEVGGLA